jgi:putative ABC transport system permease protein
MDAKKSEVLQGTLDLMILKTLHSLGPMHGFGVARRNEQVSRDITLDDRINQRLYAGARFGSLLMTIFGCIGLILVTVSVYSVLAYSTTRKTHEIGIRMALGVERGDVLGMVVRSRLRLVIVGIAMG